MQTSGERLVIFDQELVDLFSAASHDRNPLHTSTEYARATAYGEPVVFGVLAALTVLARLPGPGDSRIARVEISFQQPVFIGPRYEVVVADTGSGRRGELRRDGQPTVTVAVSYTARAAAQDQEPSGVPAARPPVSRLASIREQPVDRSAGELRAGSAVEGEYRADAIGELVSRLGLDLGAIPEANLTALLWGSYLAGMELPGRQALLASLTVDFLGAPPAHDSWFRAEVHHVDQRFHLIHVKGRLWAGHRPVADATVAAFVRPASTVPDAARVRAALSGGPELVGRTAVVVGASRGLGAATALALAYRGCHVVGCYQVSRSRAADVARGAESIGGSIEMIRGDAGDAAFCEELAGHVRTGHGQVDMLVCAAGPVLRPMRLSARTAPGLAEYVAASMRLVATPIGAFLPLLEPAAGQVLVVSSQAVSAPPADWPHYVAAKGAIEHLVRALVPAHPRVRFLLARPSRMDTDYVSELIAADPVTASPVSVAAELVRELGRPDWDGYRIVTV